MDFEVALEKGQAIWGDGARAVVSTAWDHRAMDSGFRTLTVRVVVSVSVSVLSKAWVGGSVVAAGLAQQFLLLTSCLKPSLASGPNNTGMESHD